MALLVPVPLWVCAWYFGRAGSGWPLEVAVSFNAGDHLITLDGDINIGCSTELKTALAGALATKAPVKLHVSAVERVDISSIQLLWAAAREAEDAGMPLVVEGSVPATLGETLRNAGFKSFPIPAFDGQSTPQPGEFGE